MYVTYFPDGEQTAYLQSQNLFLFSRTTITQSLITTHHHNNCDTTTPNEHNIYNYYVDVSLILDRMHPIVIICIVTASLKFVSAETDPLATRNLN
jgi:hypothetical protein